MMQISDLQRQCGSIDIYLFDQLLRGRLAPGMRVLDVGCGNGRNLVYLLQAGFEVFGIDPDPGAVGAVQALARQLAPHLPAANFRVSSAEQLGSAEVRADLVISSAVLHFARDDAQFRAMLDGTWRAVAPRGMLFCRLASSIGLEGQVVPIGGRRHRLPDGSERYLVDEALLMRMTRALGGTLLDPLKTTVVQGQRAMTTWVVQRA